MNDYENEKARNLFSRLFVLAVDNKINLDAFTNLLEKSDFVRSIERNQYNTIYEKSLEELMPEFDEMMERYCYEKIWTELTEREKEIVLALCKSNNGRMRAKDIKTITGLTDQSYPTYRKSLSMNGIVNTSNYGYCELALPRFKEIITRIQILE